MNYELIEKYIDDLRKKDEYSIKLEHIKTIKSDLEKYIDNLSDKNYYEDSKSYFLLMLVNYHMQNKNKIIDNLLKSINLLNNSNSEDKIYEAILYGYLSNYHTQYSEEHISAPIEDIAKAKLNLCFDGDELVQFYLRHVKILMNKNHTKEEIKPYIDKVHKIIKENNLKYIARYYCDIAKVYLNIFDNTVVAIFYLSQSLDLAIKTSQLDLEIRNRIFLALSYTSLENDLESINYLKPILNDNKYENINSVYKITVANNLMCNYLRLEKFEKAHKYLAFIESNYISNNLLNNIQLEMIICMCKAEYYSKVQSNKIKEAIKYIEKSRDLYEKNIFQNIFQNIDISIDRIEGNIYYRSGNYKKACELHNNGLEKSIQRNKNKFTIEFYKLLSMDFEKLKELKKSIDSIKKYMILSEKWFKKQNNEYTKILLKEYDIYEKEDKISQLTYLKDILIDKRNKDALTGLLNRRFLNEFIVENCNNYKHDGLVSMLMIDIDYFKKYNDKYGHLKGDEVLSKIGKLLNSICHKDKDMAVRYGGEEFLLLIQNTTYEESINLANEVLNKVRDLNIEHEE
jgi:diguanylate cyclase (GGDEF)-like protein